jgi:hypothetical protein
MVGLAKLLRGIRVLGGRQIWAVIDHAANPTA